VTLTSYPTQEWVADPVNYYITFADDGYIRQFKILSKTLGVLTVLDDEDFLPTSAALAWKINGYRKREVLNLLNYSIGYRTISMTQDTAHAEVAE
jgi:hypothetical protein